MKRGLIMLIIVLVIVGVIFGSYYLFPMGQGGSNQESYQFFQKAVDELKDNLGSS